MHELLKKSAIELLALLDNREISPVDLVEASAQRIEEVEPQINAMPTTCIEQALDKTKTMSFSNSEQKRGWLGGLPISIKDLMETKGIRTTFGSVIYKDYVPSCSDICVKVLEHNGAIVMGKSNTPEFGAGASTFNDVFGKTRNPWNTSKSVAGSSGGACASVASGEVWLATGSDLGGSLRTPASFNSVVGLRPSPGRVPQDDKLQPFNTLHVNGPIARNTQDLALFLDAMAIYHPSDPLTYERNEISYVDFLQIEQKPKQIAYSSDLGITVTDPEVDAICRRAVEMFSDLDIVVEENCSDFTGAIESFNVLRSFLFATNLVNEYEKHRDRLKPEIVWNIEQGLNLSAEDIGKAEKTRAKIYRSICKLFEKYDLLVCPCAIVPPFDVDMRYVESIGDKKFETYYEWIAITFAITLTGCPALSVPAGFTADGLPVGLQIIAPPRKEAELLGAGYLLEKMTEIHKKLPIDPVLP